MAASADSAHDRKDACMAGSTEEQSVWQALGCLHIAARLMSDEQIELRVRQG
jgi:hypothetical protein